MNYYPFHVGDYAAHTAHLSWEEDIAYRRMLDVYYLHERALPGDLLKVARLIRMPKSGAAVEAVLMEFFTLSDDGWHNKRADAELTAMLTKKEQQSTKDAHEAERMRRHRERRAEVFTALRAVNVVPPWDVPMKELQRLYDEHCNGPATRTGTDLQREQASPATAIPIPIPIPIPENNTPIPPDGGRPGGLRPSPQQPWSTTPTSSRPSEPPKQRSAPAVGLKAWLEQVKARGEKAIPDGDAVFAYAEETGIPHDFIRLAWLEFRARYCQPDAKRYRDWRAVFRKAIRGNWLKLWYIDGQGAYGLTTVGHQAKRAHDERVAA